MLHVLLLIVVFGRVECSSLPRFIFANQHLQIMSRFLCHTVQRFQEMDGNAKKFTLPLFGQLGRASSAQRMGPGQHHLLSASFSTPTSVQDLSISPPVSPTKPPLIPILSRRQRRASMVGLHPPSPFSFIPLSLFFSHSPLGLIFSSLTSLYVTSSLLPLGFPLLLRPSLSLPFPLPCSLFYFSDHLYLLSPHSFTHNYVDVSLSPLPQSELGYGKIQTYSKLEKLGEVGIM